MLDMKMDNKNNAERRQRRLEGIKLQEIEGNPLTAEEIDMFEMFDREGWSDEKCRAHILEYALLRQKSSPVAK